MAERTVILSLVKSFNNLENVENIEGQGSPQILEKAFQDSEILLLPVLRKIFEESSWISRVSILFRT